MNRARRAILILAAGCSHRSGYQADATLISDGQYMIRSAPDSDEKSEGLATQYAHERASDVCPSGYEIVETKAGVMTTTEHVAVFGRRSVEHPEVVLVVRCQEPPTKAR
jgi:hypothetical protein